MNAKQFICPECGANQVSDMWEIEQVHKTGDVWSAVLFMARCAKCRSIVPSHLGERWHDRTLEQARKEWRESFRNTQPRIP